MADRVGEPPGAAELVATSSGRAFPAQHPSSPWQATGQYPHFSMPHYGHGAWPPLSGGMMDTRNHLAYTSLLHGRVGGPMPTGAFPSAAWAAHPRAEEPPFQQTQQDGSHGPRPMQTTAYGRPPAYQAAGAGGDGWEGTPRGWGMLTPDFSYMLDGPRRFSASDVPDMRRQPAGRHLLPGAPYGPGWQHLLTSQQYPARPSPPIGGFAPSPGNPYNVPTMDGAPSPNVGTAAQHHPGTHWVAQSVQEQHYMQQPAQQMQRQRQQQTSEWMMLDVPLASRGGSFTDSGTATASRVSLPAMEGALPPPLDVHSFDPLASWYVRHYGKPCREGGSPFEEEVSSGGPHKSGASSPTGRPPTPAKLRLVPGMSFEPVPRSSHASGSAAGPQPAATASNLPAPTELLSGWKANRGGAPSSMRWWMDMEQCFGAAITGRRPSSQVGNKRMRDVKLDAAAGSNMTGHGITLVGSCGDDPRKPVRAKRPRRTSERAADPAAASDEDRHSSPAGSPQCEGVAVQSECGDHANASPTRGAAPSSSGRPQSPEKEDEEQQVQDDSGEAST